jgi:hypothetical protein
MHTVTYMRKCKKHNTGSLRNNINFVMWKFSFVGFMRHKCTKLEPVTTKECIVVCATIICIIWLHCC